MSSKKVTLIKDIDFKHPHRAHIDILFDLALEPLNQTHGVHNFVELHRAWEKTLDTEELNKRFYRELFAWFEWAVAEGEFPTNEKRTLKPEEHIIRLITRLLFVWFIKEKGLIADALFTETQIFPFTKGLRSGYRRFLLSRRATEPVLCHTKHRDRETSVYQRRKHRAIAISHCIAIRIS